MMKRLYVGFVFLLLLRVMYAIQLDDVRVYGFGKSRIVRFSNTKDNVIAIGGEGLFVLRIKGKNNVRTIKNLSKQALWI